MSFGLLIKIALIIAIFLIILWILNKLIISRSGATDKLDNLRDESNANSITEAKITNDTEASSSADTMERILSSVGVDVEEKKKSFGSKLYLAGVSDRYGSTLFLFWRYFGWIFAIIFFFAIASTAPNNNATIKYATYLLGFLVAVYIAFGANLWLENKITKRKKLLLNSFPDSLDLLLVCVESGLALDAALARVSKELGFAHPEIAQELNKTRVELTMLNDRERALTNLAARTDLPAFKNLVASLLQSEKFGTSLTETLRVLANEYRDNRMALAEEKAGRLPALMTIPLITLMLPALLLLIMSPAIIKLLNVV